MKVSYRPRCGKLTSFPRVPFLNVSRHALIRNAPSDRPGVERLRSPLRGAGLGAGLTTGHLLPDLRLLVLGATGVHARAQAGAARPSSSVLSRPITHSKASRPCRENSTENSGGCAPLTCKTKTAAVRVPSRFCSKASPGGHLRT